MFGRQSRFGNSIEAQKSEPCDCTIVFCGRIVFYGVRVEIEVQVSIRLELVPLALTHLGTVLYTIPSIQWRVETRASPLSMLSARGSKNKTSRMFNALMQVQLSAHTKSFGDRLHTRYRTVEYAYAAVAFCRSRRLPCSYVPGPQQQSQKSEATGL